jgi:hypothetical protein
MYILLNNVKARGSKIYGSIFISFKLQNLSKDDLEFLEFKNINPRKSENAFTTSFLLTNSDSNYTITQTIRYYSDSEPFKNICSATNKDKNCSPVIVLKEPWQGVVDNKYTATEKSWRVVATPFAVVADIILIPYYAYQLTKESQTPHFCEGEFCGYDNIKQNNPNEKPQ